MNKWRKCGMSVVITLLMMMRPAVAIRRAVIGLEVGFRVRNFRVVRVRIRNFSGVGFKVLRFMAVDSTMAFMANKRFFLSPRKWLSIACNRTYRDSMRHSKTSVNLSRKRGGIARWYSNIEITI